jgi:hypothetical protein
MLCAKTGTEDLYSTVDGLARIEPEVEGASCPALLWSAGEASLSLPVASTSSRVFSSVSSSAEITSALINKHLLGGYIPVALNHL